MCMRDVLQRPCTAGARDEIPRHWESSYAEGCVSASGVSRKHSGDDGILRTPLGAAANECARKTKRVEVKGWTRCFPFENDDDTYARGGPGRVVRTRTVYNKYRFIMCAVCSRVRFPPARARGPRREYERDTTYRDSWHARRRRRGRPAGEQAVQSAQDRMEHDTHGGTHG